MRVVVNATPLISLAMARRLDLLRQLFDEIIVPAAVYEEVAVKGAGRPGANVVAQAAWLQVESPTAQLTVEPLLMGLDVGEMQVLLLGREKRADWVLIDERLGRRVARAMGLQPKGTLGVLLAGVLANLLSRDEALDAMQQMLQGNIRVSPRWQAWLKDELAKL
jgi:predicted nucleic acid-binding protein